MARIIEFQGKTVDTEEWITGNLCIENSLHNQYEKQNYTYCYIETKTDDGGFIKRLVIPETIGQFTNATGIDGKRIYDHDIVSNDICTGEVYWNYLYNGWRIAATNRSDNLYDTNLDRTYKVVGHKYDELIPIVLHKNKEKFV